MNENSKFDRSINVNGVDIAYQLHGNALHPTLLLIHGLSTPLNGWPIAMVELFVAQGYQVLLLDNRDVGRSEQLDHLFIPKVSLCVFKLKLGLAIKVPYQLEDMMQDTVALLDALKLPEVHVVGASMGGMIAQLMAIHYPHRVTTLTSIMSTTGCKKLPEIDKKIRETLMQKPASKNYKDLMHHHIKIWRVIGSPNYPDSNSYLHEYVDCML
jgi:pimeloyl-ACP methyl ester carboxylesterase